MGILDSTKNVKLTPAAAKRSSTQMDFSNLAPLKPGGTVGFSAFRDVESATTHKSKSRKKASGTSPADSDDDDDDDDEMGIIGKMDEDDGEVKTSLGPDDAKFSGELADGVGRIKVSSLQNFHGASH